MSDVDSRDHNLHDVSNHAQTLSNVDHHDQSLNDKDLRGHTLCDDDHHGCNQDDVELYDCSDIQNQLTHLHGDRSGHIHDDHLCS